MDWRLTTIGEQILLQRGIDITRAEQRPGPIPVISSGGISSWHDTAGAAGPGVVLGRKGVVGSVWYIESDYWPHDTTLYVRDFKGNDPRFVYYFFKYKAPLLAMLDVGSANPTLNRNHVHPTPVMWPTLPTQRAIAGVLGAIDNKIDLNGRMNDLLEEAARALFRSWFVDFDPVRAKAKGRRPFGLDAELADLFPDGFEESELGEVPRGWRVEPLDSIAKFLNGLALQRFPPVPGRPTLPVIKIAQLRAGSPTAGELADAALPSQYVIENGDVIFSWSGSLLVDFWCAGRGALNQHLFKVTSDKYPKWFFKGWLDHHLPGFQAIAADKATTMGHIQRHHLTEAKVVVPSDGIVPQAERTFAPLIDRMIACRVESQTLARLRDYLLPRLLSGDVQVADETEAA